MVESKGPEEAASPRWDVSFLAYRAGAAVARNTPRQVPLIEFGGLACAALMPARRAVVARHQRRVGGDSGLTGFRLQVATLRAFASYARYWGESARLSTCTSAELRAHICFEGFEHLRAGLHAGKGVILGLPHMGSWDYAGAALGALGYPMTVVVEAGGHDALFSWFADSRRALGLTVVPHGPRAATSLLGVLRSGGLVGLVCDRELGGGGVPVSFFGEVTNLPAGPALLALRTGAALLPTAVVDLPRGGHLGILRPPLDTSRKGALGEDVARVTAGLASELEGLIRRAPEQWHLFQPNWPSDPECRDHTNLRPGGLGTRTR